MEMLGTLEKKVEYLVTLVKKFKEENERLCKERDALKERVVQLEGSLLKENEFLNTERVTAREAVADLIASIDSLIESENPS